jgi:uncharacterized phage protein gp47/JayE
VAYFAPYIDASGLHIPSFQDILDFLTTGIKGIYGNDIYINSDSADGQLLNIYALIASDCNKGLQYVYNNRGPASAIGAALDGIIKLNGMVRNIASYSTCEVILFGIPGTVINANSSCRDVNNFLWDVTKPSSPNITPFNSLPDSILIETGVAAIIPNASNLGINYLVGDTITIDGGDNNATCSVESIGSLGSVTGLTLLTTGNNYSVASAQTTLGGSGTGLKVDIQAIGAINTSAVCETIGPITATANQINQIATPQAGWTSVNNNTFAIAGNPVEVDSKVRARQAISTALPSQTRLEGTEAAIAALAGVTRYLVLENYTNLPSTDPNGLGLPGHSITCVVEGDTDTNVAVAIYNNRGIGAYTNNGGVGTPITVALTNIYNITTNINFIRPQYVPIYVTVVLKPLSNFSSSLLATVQTAIVNYLNSLNIYELVAMSGLWGAALSVQPNISRPAFAIESLVLGLTNTNQTSTDVPITYYQVPLGIPANVLVSTTS